ncbi:hypothetical protein WMF27_19975 [Sorangium sp. So ce281]|uniref:hypothetical protein n=1 Tax=unclassified Sorangium TaxID=2621164 RepID=UPI003F5E428F
MKNVSNKLWKLACMLPVLLMGIGCVAATGEQADDELVGTAEQAFTGYWGWSRATDNDFTPAWSVGSKAEMTCFLSGVAGDLSANGPSIYASQAGVWHGYGDGWILDTSGDDMDVKVKTTILCVPSIANRTTAVKWSSGQAAKVLAPVTANRRCGLMRVTNDPESGDNEWQAAGDSVLVWNDGTNWYIGGTGNAEGWGMCVDASSGTGIGVWTYIAPSSGSATHNLVQAIDNGTTPLGTQCFLTGVGGRFQANSWTDGVFVTYDPGSTWWKVTVSNGKTADIMCIQ